MVVGWGKHVSVRTTARTRNVSFIPCSFKMFESCDVDLGWQAHVSREKKDGRAGLRKTITMRLCISTVMARLADVFGEAAGFQVGEQALDFGVAIKTIKFFGDVVVDELDLGRSGGFGVINALLQAIEGGAVGTIAESN